MIVWAVYNDVAYTGSFMHSLYVTEALAQEACDALNEDRNNPDHEEFYVESEEVRGDEDHSLLPDAFDDMRKAVDYHARHRHMMPATTRPIWDKWFSEEEPWKHI